MKKCKKCGGTIHFADGCRLCELFASSRVPDGHRSACWPMKGSYALGVHPSQVEYVSEVAKKLGVPTRFEGQRDGSTGNLLPIFTSQKHKKEYCERVEGNLTGTKVIDLNGGYGDPQ